MVWSSNLHVGYLVTNEVDCRPRENDHVFLSGFWSINCTLLRLPKWRRNVSSSFAKGYHWSKFQLHIIYGSWESSTNHVCTKSPTYEGLISHTLPLSLYFAFWLFFSHFEFCSYLSGLFSIFFSLYFNIFKSQDIPWEFIVKNYMFSSILLQVWTTLSQAFTLFIT